MDWKYIHFLNLDDLNDNEKDELFNIVTWFDCETESLEERKYKTLIRACQEVLKYKGEQVETLLHELEEMAIKEAEEDAARFQESEAEMKSSRSKKSSSIEYENLEQKYMELKSKFKKISKYNEKKEAEVNKLNNKLKLLEQENRRLQNEVQSGPHDVGSSESDISENTKDKQKELVETLHNKNRHISDLLQDIEEVEKENSVLRDKLSKVRDELSVATDEILKFSELLKEKESLIQESKDNINLLTSENVDIKNKLNELQQEKYALEAEMKTTTEKLNKKLKEVQEELNSKVKEIQNLKAGLKEPSLNSSLSSLPKDDPEPEQPQSYLLALQRALNDREIQIMDVQSQLQIATKEMEEVTSMLAKLKSQKKEEQVKVKELSENNLELKKQLKNVHERCQKLHDELSFAEESVRSKDEELKHIIKNMKENGQVELAINLQSIEQLKVDGKLKEKQIIALVKTANKLQETCSLLEKENFSLRESLGIPEEEAVNLSGYNSKHRKLKKEIEYLKHQLLNKEEAVLQLKSEIQKLNRTVHSSADQIVQGYKPQSQHTNEEMKSLVEENEALRRGLHEIMNSIRTTKSEIKSETFEQLLRALDVKHMSGWYHPAMRLQAELHSLEGVNSELRGQLRLATTGGKLSENKDDELKENDEAESVTVDSGINLEEVLSENVEERVKMLFETSKPLKFVHNQVLLCVRHLTASKTKLEEDVKVSEEKLNAIQEENNILFSKLKILISETDEEKVKKINEVISVNVSLNRKSVYLENESKKLYDKIENLEKDLNKVERSYIKSLTSLQNKIVHLESNLKISQNLNNSAVKFEMYKECEKNLNNITQKYRDLTASIQKLKENNELELDILLKSQNSLESEKNELSIKLTNLLAKEVLLSVKDFPDREEKLAQKLAEAEIMEIAERQRANHTNNLYELVKEQLTKSEEKFKEFAKFNDDLLKKNLTLQEQLIDAQEKITEYVDKTSYDQLQKSNNDLIKEKEDLTIQINNLEAELKLSKQEKEYDKTWNNSKEQELLHLKHQIVDLISNSDEKVIMAQLSGDVLQNRKLIEFYKVSLNGLTDELERMKEKNKAVEKKVEEERNVLTEREIVFKNRIEHLQYLLNQLKIQFYGYIPIISEEVYVNNVIAINNEKHEAFIALQKAKEIENDAATKGEQLILELEFVKKQKEIGTGSYKEEYRKMANWMQEKKTYQISELRLKRLLEFKESQLQHLLNKVKIQDEHILKIDQELLNAYKNVDSNISQKDDNSIARTVQGSSEEKVIKPGPVPLPRKITRSVSVQADEPNNRPQSSAEKGILVNLKSELARLREDLGQREHQINLLKSKLTEQEMTISMFRGQIGDKQSQISFYEKHILELQSKKAEIAEEGVEDGNINVRSTGNEKEEILILKNTLTAAKEEINAKDEKIIKYQTLLKNDRDKHSLAAATLQDELQSLQKQLAEEKENVKSLDEAYVKTRPNRAALEQYVAQVHSLEKYTSELHTKMASLEAQLQSSREETVRWQTMANDRLAAMEELRKGLDQQHQKELELYKSDSERMREIGNDEINCLKQLVLRQKGELTGRLDSDIQRLIREKDDKIHEMIVKLRQMKNVKKFEPLDLDLPLKRGDLELTKDLLQKENELLKKKCEQLLLKEKNAREEINNLKFQLVKKPISARSDKSDKSIKDQLQKKINTLEKEALDLKQNLNEQIAINETHKIQSNEDFNKWKRMKHWQQSSEKLKNKLKERDNELEKLQQTSAGYRLLIERLEREKRNLENRVKTLKSSNLNTVYNAELESLKRENMNLLSDLDALQNKMEIHQHHSGALGATMLQEKLEGQERKIAVLELAAKGPSELRSELERLQNSNAALQKSNLRMEAEILDLKLDLEKSNKEVPHLQQQIQHLENYVGALKGENEKQENISNNPQSSELKKASELERTVFILKRVVEKLQAENKRLLSGKRPLSNKSASAEKLKRDYLILKRDHSECAQKIEQLEKELESARNKLKNVIDDRVAALSSELSSIKEKLEVKCVLLDKVKMLLHRAAAKEKTLLQEIAELKSERNLVISPIVEESENSTISDIP